MPAVTRCRAALFAGAGLMLAAVGTWASALPAGASPAARPTPGPVPSPYTVAINPGNVPTTASGFSAHGCDEFANKPAADDGWLFVASPDDFLKFEAVFDQGTVTVTSQSDTSATQYFPKPYQHLAIVTARGWTLENAYAVLSSSRGFFVLSHTCAATALTGSTTPSPSASTATSSAQPSSSSSSHPSSSTPSSHSNSPGAPQVGAHSSPANQLSAGGVSVLGEHVTRPQTAPQPGTAVLGTGATRSALGTGAARSLPFTGVPAGLLFALALALAGMGTGLLVTANRFGRPVLAAGVNETPTAPRRAPATGSANPAVDQLRWGSRTVR